LQYILSGEQPRYNFSPCISDYNGIHWYFSTGGLSSINDTRIEKIIEKYPVKLNPMFHPGDDVGNLLSSEFKDYVQRYHPSQFETLTTTLYSSSAESIVELYGKIKPDTQSISLHMGRFTRITKSQYT
jgi:hypothetical protein